MSDMAHSVAQRLLNFSKANNEEYNFILARYGVEPLLYRLSQSPTGQRFVLKGASLFLVWFGHAFRTTRDVDLLGVGSSDLEAMPGSFASSRSRYGSRRWIGFPTLLDGPAPSLLAYPPYTAIDEKFQAMVVLDMANSRMKDFYDICVLFRSFTLDAEILATAVRRTFERPGDGFAREDTRGTDQDIFRGSDEANPVERFCQKEPAHLAHGWIA